MTSSKDERNVTPSTTALTEEEASRYDRQMRLWGLEAQQRMRNATILVVRLRGVATEAIKNMVLAGIGKLLIVDGEDVTEEDLGAGFFYRDEDVGRKVRLKPPSILSSSLFFHASSFVVRGIDGYFSDACATLPAAILETGGRQTKNRESQPPRDSGSHCREYLPR